MAIELRRKADDTKVKEGDTLTTKRGDFRVKWIMGPSFKFGAAGIVGEDGLVRLPSECGCYATTV